MVTVSYQKILLGFMAVILGCMLPACSSALSLTGSQTPSVAPSPTTRHTPNLPLNWEEVEDELVTMLLDSIVQAIKAESSVDKYLIVWSPVQGSRESPTLAMNIEEPIKVWIYEGDQLTEASDPIGAIEQYRQENMDADSYGLYDLGILSIAEDGQIAEVYLGFDCGGLNCHGHAEYFIYARNEAGLWEISGEGTYIIE